MICPHCGIWELASEDSFCSWCGKYQPLFTNQEQTKDDPSKKVPPSEQCYVAFALFDDKIKVVSLLPDGSYKFIDQEHNLHHIIHIASETVALQIAIDELETLVNDPKSKEQDFQAFFEKNPDFILNSDYRRAHPHITLIIDEENMLIPDFILEPVEQSAFCDILELKLPSAPIFVLKKNRERFSAAVTEARAQLQTYGRYFNEQAHRDLIYSKYGLRAWMPKMFLIIGRLGNIDPYAKRTIEVSEPNLNLSTYDDVINRMKAKLERMKAGGRIV